MATCQGCFSCKFNAPAEIRLDDTVGSCQLYSSVVPILWPQHEGEGQSEYAFDLFQQVMFLVLQRLGEIGQAVGCKMESLLENGWGCLHNCLSALHLGDKVMINWI